MVVKIFALLLAVNLFSVIATAEAAEYGDYGEVDGYNSVTGDDEILIEKELSKTNCLLRVASMLGSQWFNDAIELQRLGSENSKAPVSRYPYSFKESLAQARYGMDVGSDQVSLSMKIKF